MTREKEIARVAVIGAGNIGSRHLQALVKIERPLEIYAVDPSPTALQQAARGLDEAASDRQVSVCYLDDLGGLPPSLDVAIVATRSKERRGVTEAMLEQTKVRFLILEKILFPSPADYGAVATLLREKSVVAYVNCAQRLYPLYQRLRTEIGDAGPVDVQVTGSSWRLATNCIHYLDLAAFLSGRADVHLDHVHIDEMEDDPRYGGSVDFFGNVQGRFGDGSTVSVRSFKAGGTPVTVTIRTPDRLCIVNERLRRAWVYDNASSWTPSETEAPMPRQSEMSHHIVDSLLDTGGCGLPSYQDSSAWPRPPSFGGAG